MSATKTYTVKAGDTLQSIAAMRLGDESLWQYLASINSIKSPYTVLPGQVITVEVAEVTDTPIKGFSIIFLIALAAGIYYYNKND
jgi:LysM repeat protein